MKCVVPLAGPDLLLPNGQLRPLFEVDGRPLIEVALESRRWRISRHLGSDDYIFVVREVERLTELRSYLAATWPGCRIVQINSLTEGALLSALAGAALVGTGEGPICIDLADILFDGPVTDLASWPTSLGALVPTFESQDESYSYLRSEAGRVVEAAEKRVISDRASAGVYFFKDLATYLQAAAHSIQHRDRLSYRNVLFVCPAINGVIGLGLDVGAPEVWNTRPIGKMFHG